MADIQLATIDVTEALQAQAGIVPTAPAPPRMTQIERHASWPTLSQLRMTTATSIALNGFKIRDLLRLEPGQVVESAWPETEDVPLYVGQVQVAWGEFEVVEQRLVVRLTRLA
jgi:flagellar motor switch protein FliN/FliY